MLSFNAAEKTVMSFEIDISELILCFVPDLFMLYHAFVQKKAIVHPLRYRFNTFQILKTLVKASFYI